MSSVRRPSARIRPPIVAARLLLRPFQEGDLAPLQRILDDPSVKAQIPEEPRALAVAERAEAGRGRVTASVYDYAVVVRRTGRLAGACELVLGPQQTAEVGYLLGRHHWGRGYGTEIVRSLTAFAFDALSIRQVFAVVAADNHRSLRVLAKSGFVWDGSLKPRKDPTGRRTAVDRYVCRLAIAANPS